MGRRIERVEGDACGKRNDAMGIYVVILLHISK